QDFVYAQIPTEGEYSLRTLHDRAARYYTTELARTDQKRTQESAYLQWYRYEDAEWQRLIQAWLYHLAHTDERSHARLALARVYFDAFWWWGAYVEFPFCEELLDTWEQTQTAPR